MTTPQTASGDPVLDEVVVILAEVIGDDFLLDVEVTPSTSFNEDLAMESIEFVALAERLQDRYGGDVDFVAFVGEMNIDQIMAMTVGQLVDYIRRCVGDAAGV
jgi:acyl carrier protein